jgi:PRC-barrel domain
MSDLKPLRLLSAAALVSACSLAAVAQQAPEPTPPAEKPPMTKPEAVPAPTPVPPEQKPATSSKATQGAANELVGLAAFSSDGSRVGDVRAVTTMPDGKMTLHIKTGGFLGFGGRIVAIPEARYTRSGQNIQLGLTADEVSKLPEVKDAS